MMAFGLPAIGSSVGALRPGIPAAVTGRPPKVRTRALTESAAPFVEIPKMTWRSPRRANAPGALHQRPPTAPETGPQTPFVSINRLRETW